MNGSGDSKNPQGVEKQETQANWTDDPRCDPGR